MDNDINLDARELFDLLKTIPKDGKTPFAAARSNQTGAAAPDSNY